MPSDPLNNPSATTLGKQADPPKASPVRDGEPDWKPKKPQFLEGKMTFLGLAILLLNWLLKKYGVELPGEELRALAQSISDNWGGIADVIGWSATFWGRLRINWRRAAPLIALLFLCQSSFAQFGWKPSPHGIKAPTIRFKAAPLPASASLEQWFYPTNQADRGACVAFTAWESYSASHQKLTGKKSELSPLDIYQQCLVRDGSFPNDNGTYGMTAITALLQTGSMTEKLWPYSRPLEILPALTPAMKGSRTKHKALKAYAVPVNDGGFAIKNCIANLKVPVMIGSYWYNNGMTARKVQCSTKDASGATQTVTRFVLPYPSGRPVGGHEVPIGAYDDNMIFPDGSIGGAWIHNHWSPPGQPWGDERGGAWISYKWAFNPRIVEDAVVIEIVKP